MPYYGSQNPPPLPPRSPRPAVNTTPSPGGTHWGYPQPPSGQSPGPGYPPYHQPPPLPPRPSGFEVNTASGSCTPAQLSPSYPIPPPPPGPPPGMAAPDHVAHPHLRVDVARPGQNHGYSPAPSPSSGAQSPNTLIHLPPPPPGPPPRNPNSPSPNGQYTIPPYQPVPHVQVSPQTTYSPSIYSQPFYSPQTSPTETSSSPPPAYTPFEEPSSQKPPVTASSPSALSSHQQPATTPTPQSPHRHSSSPQPPVVSPQTGGLESQFESLAVEAKPGSSYRPSVPQKTPYAHQPNSNQNHQHSAPAAPAPPTTSPAPNPTYKAYQRPTANTTTPQPTIPTPAPARYASPLPPPSSPRPQPQPQPQQPSQPPATSCIDTPSPFPTTWHWHPSAPLFLICSRCHTDHILPTPLATSFTGRRLYTDGQPRGGCRFSKPRMRDRLFPAALKKGDGETVAWMRARSGIPDCKGVGGVKGGDASSAAAGGGGGGGEINWHRAKNHAIPGLVACEACYEDYILAHPGLATNFERTPPQPRGETWACDFAVPFIEREFEARGGKGSSKAGISSVTHSNASEGGNGNDWAGFVAEAKARLSIAPCPQRAQVPTHARRWFVPKDNNDGGLLRLCAACYCDQVLHTGPEEEAKWRAASEPTPGTYTRCSMGVFSIKIALARAHETKDFAAFWTAMRKLAREKPCDDEGIADGSGWFSLPSDPDNFGVCAGCYVGMLEPLGVSRFFVAKRLAQPPGVRWRCAFNMAHPRFRPFVQRLLELYYTHDATSLERYAGVYASIPPCPRDEDAKGGRWYGWVDCTICPECYHEFARHGALAAKMELENAVLETNAMCEMYSPRMRKLYRECSESSPADPKPLLAFSVQRRRVWVETVPQIKMILFRAKLGVNQQQFLNTTSTFYNTMGMVEQTLYGNTHTYGMAGVGHGYANMNLLQGAMYNQQAMGIGTTAAGPGSVMIVGQLEQKWRAVE